LMLTLTEVRCSVRPICSAMPMNRWLKMERVMGSHSVEAAEAVRWGSSSASGACVCRECWKRVLGGVSLDAVGLAVGGGRWGAAAQHRGVATVAAGVVEAGAQAWSPGWCTMQPRAVNAAASAAHAVALGHEMRIDTPSAGGYPRMSMRTSRRRVTWAVQPGSTTTVLMASMRMAGPGSDEPGARLVSRYTGVSRRPPCSKHALTTASGGGSASACACVCGGAGGGVGRVRVWGLGVYRRECC
jgi:hypothetical protein